MRPLRRSAGYRWIALLLALVGVLLLGLGIETVRAHALLARSSPASNAELTEPPTTIEMWFSEPLEAGFSDARLLDSAGEEVETGAVTIDPSDPTHMSLPLGELEPGIYTVAWQTLSQVDGHEWYGSFPFTVLNPDGSRPTGAAATTIAGRSGDLPAPDEAASRWLLLLGGMLFFGAPLFRLLVVSTEQDETALTAYARMGVRYAVYAAAALIVVGSVLQLLLQALRLGGLSTLPGLLFDTRTGVLILGRQLLATIGLLVVLGFPHVRAYTRRQRQGLMLIAAYGLILLLALIATMRYGVRASVLATLAVAGVVLALAGTARGSTPAQVRRRIDQTLLVLSGALLLSVSTGSHAGAVPGYAWAILADYVHLLAAAAWLGGLVLLPALLWQLRRDEATFDRTALLQLVRRFSYLAGFAVFILALTGLFNSLVQLPSLSSLWDTTYGRVLLAKLFLVALVVEVAFLNNRFVHGHTQRLTRAAGLRHFHRWVALEAGVGLILLLSVAVLVQTPAPASLTPRSGAATADLPFNTIEQVDDLSMHVQVTPNTVGTNRFWVHLYHPDGSPIGEVQLVRLFFEYQEAELGRATVDLTPLGDDTFAVEGAYLNQDGTWELSVYVRRRGMEDSLTAVTVDVPEPAGATTATRPWQNPIPTLPSMLLIASILVAMGVVPFIWYRPARDLTADRLHPATVVAAIFVLVGVGLGLTSAPDLLASSGTDDPLPATTDSIETGANLYEAHCARCHGETGQGDGPQAVGMNPPPANMPLHIPLHDKRELYGYIANGFPGTAMPAFEGTLTSEEIWHLVNYLTDEFGDGN